MSAIEVFSVAVCFGIVVDTIAQQVADRRRVGVVMVQISGLVCVGCVEGDTLVDVGIAIPDAISPASALRTAIARTAINVGERIGCIKKGDSVNKVPD